MLLLDIKLPIDSWWVVVAWWRIGILVEIFILETRASPIKVCMGAQILGVASYPVGKFTVGPKGFGSTRIARMYPAGFLAAQNYVSHGIGPGRGLNM